MPRRLTPREAKRVERLVGPKPEDQQAVLAFIGHYYAADNLLEIPRNVFREICRRPVAFLLAARNFAYPELF
jgi:hypothetical protein